MSSSLLPGSTRKYLTLVQDQVARLSRRERLFLLGAGLLVAFLLLLYISGPLTTAFRRQSAELAKARMDAATLPGVARRYLEIRARRAGIENRYKQVEFRDGTVLSHLEKLIREKAEIPSKEFNIRQGEARDFGRDYQQTPFTVKFSTAKVPSLVEFLKELVEGPKPMVLSRLDITRRRGSNRLDVEIDASAIKHK